MVCFFSGCRAIRNHQGSFGEIKLTIRYAGLRKKLLVVVESCRFVLKKSLIVVFFKIIPPKKLLCFLQKGLVPLQRERHGFVCPPVPAPWSGLPSPQEDTRPEEDRVPILQWEVSRKVFFFNLSDLPLSQEPGFHVVCQTSFPGRFEFDVPLTEALNRKLDVAVKNNKMFHRKEIKDIGTVGDASVWCLMLLSDQLKSFQIFQSVFLSAGDNRSLTGGSGKRHLRMVQYENSSF